MTSYDDYKVGSHPFPRHDIDPAKKILDGEDSWLLKYSEAIFAAWLRDKCAIPYTELDTFTTNRKYGAGQQDPSIYQDILLEEEDKGKPEREGWYNVNWDIFSVAPKFKNVVVGMMENQEHDIVATAIDPMSGKEREEQKWDLWMKSLYGKDFQQIDQNLGIRREPDSFIPESYNELMIYEELGGFKLKKEYAIERGIDYTFYISDWPEIKRKMIHDILDNNCCCTKDYVDKYTARVKTRYVDPSRLIMQYSRHYNHRNSEWGGEIVPMKITDIRVVAPDIPETELRELAQKYQGTNNNPSITIWETDNENSGAGSLSYKYDDFWIDVLDLEIKSVDSNYKQYRTDQRGERHYYDEEFGYVKNTETRKTKVVNTKVVYRVKWIIGTKRLFDYGYQYDVPRPGKKEVELSYHLYKLPGRSMISLIQPNLDQIQLTWLKMQNAIAMSSPSGVAVEYTSLTNMTLGGKKMDPLEILTIKRGMGDIFYRATTHRGYVNSPNAGKPVQELDGGIGRSLEEFVRIFELNFNFIRDLSGINQIADASSPDPNQSVTGSKMAISATSNALKPIYASYVHVKQETARNVSLRLQLVVKHSKESYDVYYPVLGKATLEMLRIGTEILDVDYSIKVEARPTDEEKAFIMQEVLAAMKPDKDGYIGLEWHDAALVNKLINDGNMRLAQAVMANRSKQNKQRQVQLQRENMAIDQKGQQETYTAKNQSDIQKLQQENELKKDFETHKAALDRQLEKEKHLYKMEEITLEKTAEATAKLVTGEGKTENVVPNTNK